jgi:hypothetical protein
MSTFHVSSPEQTNYFNADQERELSAEDSRALRQVCSILLAVVTAGLVLMAITVLWIVR